MTTDKTFFGFGIADSMFAHDCMILRRSLTPLEAKIIIDHEKAVPCLNPSHAESIRVMRERYDINVVIPEKAPVVQLEVGDSLLLMAISGLPRLEGRHEYTAEEVAGAKFRFALYSVIE